MKKLFGSWGGLIDSPIGMLLIIGFAMGTLLFLFDPNTLTAWVQRITSRFIQYLMYAIVFAIIFAVITSPLRGGGKK